MRDEAQAAGTNFSPWIAQVPHAAHRSRSVYHSEEALTNVSPWVAQLQTMVQHERNRKTALEEEKRNAAAAEAAAATAPAAPAFERPLWAADGTFDGCVLGCRGSGAPRPTPPPVGGGRASRTQPHPAPCWLADRRADQPRARRAYQLAHRVAPVIKYGRPRVVGACHY